MCVSLRFIAIKFTKNNSDLLCIITLHSNWFTIGIPGKPHSCETAKWHYGFSLWTNVCLEFQVVKLVKYEVRTFAFITTAQCKCRNTVLASSSRISESFLFYLSLLKAKMARAFSSFAQLVCNTDLILDFVGNNWIIVLSSSLKIIHLWRSFRQWKRTRMNGSICWNVIFV